MTKFLFGFMPGSSITEAIFLAKEIDGSLLQEEEIFAHGFLT